MYFYYAPICMVALSAFVNVINDRRADIALLSLFAFYVVMVAGLRFYSDIDYEPYLALYLETPRLAELSVTTLRFLYGEPGYLLVSSAIRSSGGEFVVVTLLASFVSILSKSLVALKLVRNASFAIALYLCLSFVTVEFIEMRWAVATGLLTLAYCYSHLGRTKVSALLFVVAISFHYFSIFFVLLAYATRFRGYSLYFLLLVSTVLLALAMKFTGFSLFFGIDSQFYIVNRALRYVNDPESSVGLFSFLKIAFYALAVFTLLELNPEREAIKADKTFSFLLRTAFGLMSAALVLSFVPLFYYRTMVIGDFFAILLICHLIGKSRALDLRVVLACMTAVLFTTWCFLDVANYESAGRITPYGSWIRFAL